MIEVAIMLEGQNGLNWPRWQAIGRAADDFGFAGLFRSDHFTNRNPPDKDSLEMWVSLTWLASHTKRIEFGPLVSPVSFRDPVMTARTALQVDDLSGGRLRLGLGAGWQEREHTNFGYELLDLPQRFQRFQEGLEVITRLMRYGDEPVDFNGQYYHLRGAILLPRPQRPGGPPIIIGGVGPKYTLPLVVRYADEWNGFDIPADRCAQLNHELDDLLVNAGRKPQDVRRSLMANVVFGRDEAEFQAKMAARDPSTLHWGGTLFGAPGQVLDQLHALEEAGIQRVMLRWMDYDDIDGLEAFAKGLGLKDGQVSG